MANPIIASQRGIYTLDTPDLHICQMAALAEGDNWTEVEDNGRFLLKCDPGTGKAVYNIVSGINANSYFDKNNELPGDTIKLFGARPSSNVTTSTIWLHGESTSMVYKILNVIDDDTIQVESIKADTTPVGPMQILIVNGFGINGIKIVAEPGEQANMRTSNGSSSFIYADGAVVDIPWNLQLNGPIIANGSADIIIY